MYPEIFARMVGGPSPTGRKSPDNILVLNGYFKETIIFQKSRQVGYKFQGVQPFQGDGAKLHFSIETYRTCCFPGDPDSLTTSGSAHCLCACVHVFDILKSPKTKHAVSSSKA